MRRLVNVWGPGDWVRRMGVSRNWEDDIDKQRSEVSADLDLPIHEPSESLLPAGFHCDHCSSARHKHNSRKSLIVPLSKTAWTRMTKSSHLTYFPSQSRTQAIRAVYIPYKMAILQPRYFNTKASRQPYFRYTTCCDTEIIYLYISRKKLFKCILFQVI